MTCALVSCGHDAKELADPSIPVARRDEAPCHEATEGNGIPDSMVFCGDLNGAVDKVAWNQLLDKVGLNLFLPQVAYVHACLISRTHCPVMWLMIEGAVFVLRV